MKHDLSFPTSFCIEPASVAPFEWPDDITKWPKCRKKLPGLGECHTFRMFANVS